ncbi:MAG: YdcF family protein [Oscillospiraceae bacterium]|nr:YdcF family protein [Oscillospiraceae bacterium]MBR5045423.1 YdcF family protein [Oscillospiraceae bacterium]MBR5071432.1 YdcF family protein [Oscillospiraceae bacterium]
MFRILIITAGMIASLYGATVISIIGTGGIFNFFYLVLGIVLIAIGAFWKTGKSKERKWQKVILILAGLGLTVFLAVEAAIITCSLKETPAGADYVILLGTQYRNDGPSVDYRARLMSAYEYLTENPDTFLIATGGQGDNEPVSEAEGARRFLTARGISEDRILIEDRSTNTVQNIRNAYELLKESGNDPAQCGVVIVSASYHLLRARFIAERIGFYDVGTKGSTGLPVLMPHFYTREFFALIKDGVLSVFDL